MTATNTATTRGAESELRAAARRRGLTHEGACGQDGHHAELSVPDCYGGQALVSGHAGEGCGRAGRDSRTGHRLSAGRRGERGEQLHPGAGSRAGHEHAGTGRACGGVLRLHDTGVRGHRNMGVKVQKRVESALQAPARVAPARCPDVDRQAVWERMEAHGISQNEVARRAGLSSGHLSQIMNGQRSLSPGILKKLHGVLFQRTPAERVMPAEVKVLGWRKGERSGMVVRGAGGPGRGDGGGTVRTGGRMPWGAKAEYAFRTGYDGRGRVSVEHVVERGCSAMLKQQDSAAA